MVRVVVVFLTLETRGDSVARRVQCGQVKVKHGLKTKAFLQGLPERTMCARKRCTIGLYGPGDKVSLFSKEWEFARVALSIALDMLVPLNA